MPLYIQIAEGLLGQIEAGQLVPGSRLPSERELSETLGVNRMTLRQALSVLENQGLVERRQGNGTYIAKPKIERETSQLIPFSKDMQQHGYIPSGKIIMLEQHLADVSVAKPLQIAISTPVYYIHRLRLINNEPVMLEKFTLPVHQFPHFEQYNLETRSLYEVMEAEYNIVVSRAEQSFEAVTVTEQEAKWLNIKPNTPLIMERRLGFDQNDRPVEYAKDVYRGDRFKFVTKIAALEL